MAKMQMPKIKGDYDKGDRGRNDQYGMHGAIEGRTVTSGSGQSPLGNKVARDVGPGGPGAGYDLIGKAGTNCQHGSDAGLSATIGSTKDTLAEFGPERRRR